jgi:hypothetical protein
MENVMLDFSKLEIGAFYWVQFSKLELASDGRTYQPTEEVFGPEPARFTGMSGGSPPRSTWDFVGVATEIENREVRWVNDNEIAFRAN